MHSADRGFTVVELLISITVLTLVLLFANSLVNSVATITTLGNKRMDADAQARQLLDRMTVDFAQMVKRSDVTYYFKGGTGGSQTGNDQIAFYSATPGYYSTTASTTQSPVSLVAYRVNSNSSNLAYNKLERLGKGLLWNGVSSTEDPLTFWQAIAAPTDANYSASGEIMGPQVFRFEYGYLLTDGTTAITPPASIAGITALIVDIAVIDPKSKVLLTNPQITTLSAQLSDFSAGILPGQVLGKWQGTLDSNTTLPRSAISGIRLYERYFYLSPPTL
jgi:prepilin-type N-terminal cleavage/methylation domain-containing protein